MNVVAPAMRLISVAEGRDLGADRRGVGRAEGAVRGFDGQLADALEHRVDFGQRAFSGLDHRDAVLGVSLGLVEARDLRLQLLADGEAGRVVGGTVDAETARQLLDALGEVAAVALRFR